MNDETLKQYKTMQGESWGLFAPLEVVTTIPAGKLVKFVQVGKEDKVLDVACGTGVVSVTAARVGARVTALDLSRALLERAKWNAATAQTEIKFIEGDVEALPFEDASFDVVLSQYGHMFAPRPEVAITEMLRVLKPGGRIGFSTWPPEHFISQIFSITAEYLPPPAGVSPTSQWGDPKVVKERLDDRVKDIVFEREVMAFPALSPQHYLETIERTAGPVIKLVETFKNSPEKLAQFRAEVIKRVSCYQDGNEIRQHYLMTRAIKG